MKKVIHKIKMNRGGRFFNRNCEDGSPLGSFLPEFIIKIDSDNSEKSGCCEKIGSK